MSLLKHHTNSELQTLFQDALIRGTSDERMTEMFGRPPYHFIGPRTGPVPRYKDFQPEFVDREGREYIQLEEPNTMGARIPIAVRRHNPIIEFPQPGEIVSILRLQNGTVHKVYIVSLQINKTRSATAWLEVS